MDTASEADGTQEATQIQTRALSYLRKNKEHGSSRSFITLKQLFAKSDPQGPADRPCFCYLELGVSKNVDSPWVTEDRVGNTAIKGLQYPQHATDYCNFPSIQKQYFFNSTITQLNVKDSLRRPWKVWLTVSSHWDWKKARPAGVMLS